MIPVTELRAGKTFQIDGVPYQVIDYKHTKMGRGTANIRVKVRNLLDGSLVEKTFISGAKVEEILTIKKKLQYLYQDGRNFYFTDPKSFEQFLLSKEVISEQAPYLREQAMVEVLFWEDKPLSIELPSKMEFTVKETGPGVKGDSAVNIFKPATLDNGLKTKVPLFINQGDKILIDTRTGEYAERIK